MTCSSWPHSDSVSVHARAQSAARAGSGRACVGATLKGILSVHQWRGGELDRGVGNNVATRRAGACQCCIHSEGVATARSR
jgi:hypothetical protein